MTQETFTGLSETMRRMCEEYRRNQEERLYGRDEQSAGNHGVFRTGEALRQVVSRNTRDFVDIVGALVDELAGNPTSPQTYLTVHQRASDFSSNYIVRLWAGRPVIDGQTGEPVSSLCPTGGHHIRYQYRDDSLQVQAIEGAHRFIHVFDTHVADLTLASNANGSRELNGRECWEHEQRNLISLLNERGVVVGQRAPTTISHGFYEAIVDFYWLHPVNMNEL